MAAERGAASVHRSGSDVVRLPDGSLVIDPSRFASPPEPLRKIADYLNQKGAPLSVRAKFRVAEVNLRPSYDTSKPEPWAVIKLGAVSDDGIPEHARYHEATPSGSIELTVNNRSAIPFFEVGKLVYVDFTADEA